MRNLIYTIFDDAEAKNLLGKCALRDHFTSLTYGEFKNVVWRACRFLIEQDVKPEDRVIVALGNTAEQVVLHYASVLVGAVVVPVPFDCGDDKLSFFIDDLDACTVFIRDGRALLGAKCFEVESFDKLAALIGDGECVDANLAAEVAESDLLSVLYTTGSTSKAKGVMITHGGARQALKNIMAYVGYVGGEEEMVCLPIYHSFGLGHVYCTHLAGGGVFLQDGIKSPKKFFKALDGDYDGAPFTPSMLKILLGRYREKAIPLLNKLKYMVINSEPIPQELTKDLCAACPDLRIMFYYGLTEASRSTFITFSDEDEAMFGSVGKPTAESVNIKIIDGEICIAGGHLFAGYWHNSENNMQDGWFRTGDLGRIDENGYLFITGRKKDQINVGGLKVSASEIVECLKNIAGLVDVAVVGIADDAAGEVPAALVVADGIDAEDVINYARQHLENFAVPRRVVFSPSIPRAETGKVLADEVRNAILNAAQ